jgi:hypothetical protein
MAKLIHSLFLTFHTNISHINFYFFSTICYLLQMKASLSIDEYESVSFYSMYHKNMEESIILYLHTLIKLNATL